MHPMQSAGVNIMPGARWDGIDKTEEVHPTEVADYIKRGWVILMAYSARQDVTEFVTENGYSNQRVRCEYMPVVLMGQTNLDALREEVARVATENARLKADSQSLQELRQKQEMIAKESAAQSERIARSEAATEDLRRRTAETENKKYKLESDIGKIRAAIGDLKMREILGEKKE